MLKGLAVHHGQGLADVVPDRILEHEVREGVAEVVADVPDRAVRREPPQDDAERVDGRGHD